MTKQKPCPCPTSGDCPTGTDALSLEKVVPRCPKCPTVPGVGQVGQWDTWTMGQISSNSDFRTVLL